MAELKENIQALNEEIKKYIKEIKEKKQQIQESVAKLERGLKQEDELEEQFHETDDVFLTGYKPYIESSLVEENERRGFRYTAEEMGKAVRSVIENLREELRVGTVKPGELEATYTRVAILTAMQEEALREEIAARGGVRRRGENVSVVTPAKPITPITPVIPTPAQEPVPVSVQVSAETPTKAPVPALTAEQLQKRVLEIKEKLKGATAYLGKLGADIASRRKELQSGRKV